MVALVYWIVPDFIDMKGEEEGVEVRAVDDRQPHVQQEEAEVSVIL